MGVPAGTPATSTHSSPSLAAFPAALFYCFRGPNREGSSPPLLTVLLLLTGENQQEGGWVEKTRVQTSEGGNASGVFFVVPGSPVRSVGGNVGGISVSFGELVPGGLQ